jgi:Domain of unknown function (DUF4124)
VKGFPVISNVEKTLPAAVFRACLLSTLLVAAALFVSSANAQVYQWKDAEGRNVITDTPPPGAKAKQIGKPQPADAPKASPSAEEPSKKSEPKKANPKTPAELAAEEKRQGELKEYCDSARSRLTELDSGMRIGAIDSKGERYVLTDEQKSAEGAKLRRGMQDAKCP